MSRKKPIDAAFLRSILDYDPLTGFFRWRVNSNQPVKWNTRYAGTIAGTIIPAGYRTIKIAKGSQYPAHVLAWLYVYGEWRPGEIDHVHGVRDDNRITELRLASASDNSCNKAMQRNNTSGFVGVSFNRKTGLWCATIDRNYKCYRVGEFVTAELAAKAREEFARKLQGAFVPTDVKRPRYFHYRDRHRSPPAEG